MRKAIIFLFFMLLILLVYGQEIFIDEVPEFLSNANLSGHVEGISEPDMYKVYVFLYFEGWWYPKPTEYGYCNIDNNFEWECDVTTGGCDNQATRYFVMLVTEDYIPPHSGHEWGQWEQFLPDEFSVFPYSFRERLQGNRELEFGGYSWICKTSTVAVSPGGNHFSDGNQNVFVSEDDDLILSISNDGEFWQCTEVICENRLGYGTYIFTLGEGLPEFPAEAVLGFFTWDEAIIFDPQIDNIYREIDMEYSYWGNETDPFSQYVIQPWDEAGNRHRFDYYPEAGVSCAFDWGEDHLEFVTYYGEAADYPPEAGDIIEEWEYTGDDIPSSGNARTRLNLWLTEDAVISEGLEVVITDFVHYAAPVTISKEMETGWNWFSLNVAGDDMSTNVVLASLGNNGSSIKSQTQSSIYYEGIGWYGSLTTLNNYTFYKMAVNNPTTLEYTGIPVNLGLNTYELTSGWNWISYAPQVAEDINYALASLENGIFIKSQTQSAVYYEGYGWYGSLNTLEPGAGYMLKMSVPEQFNFPEPEEDPGQVAVDTAEIALPETEDDGQIAEIDNLTCYPNPFNPVTTINYNLGSDVINPYLEIYNIKGQRVSELKIENVKCKMNSVVWDGSGFASGIYFYRIKGDNYISEAKKMILIK